jgi:hypothetical protein
VYNLNQFKQVQIFVTKRIVQISFSTQKKVQISFNFKNKTKPSQLLLEQVSLEASFGWLLKM